MAPLLEMAVHHRVGDFTLDAELSVGGRSLVVMGPTGAGKTILLRALAGLARPGHGRIVLQDRLVFDTASGRFVPPQARRVGYVPQDYALFPHLTVRGNVAFGLRGMGAGEAARRVTELIELTGLGAQAELRPRQLSGGQRQRVALARALAVKPDVLLLDEPFAALDIPTKQALMDDLQALLDETGTAAVMATHDRNEALRLGESVCVLMDGVVRQTGTPSEIFGSPVNEEVAAFVGAETIARGRVCQVDAGVPVIDVAGHSIEGGSGVSPGDEVLVCLRPEDITLALSTQPSSARNHLEAAVVRVMPAGPYLRVELDAGFPMFSLITRRAAEELNLAPGTEVVASFKASAVHLIRK